MPGQLLTISLPKFCSSYKDLLRVHLLSKTFPYLRGEILSPSPVPTALFAFHWSTNQSLVKTLVHVCVCIPWDHKHPGDRIQVLSPCHHACHVAGAQEGLVECNRITTWKEHTVREPLFIFKLLLGGQMSKSVTFSFFFFKQRPQTTFQAKKKMWLEGNESLCLILHWVWINNKVPASTRSFLFN